MKLRAGNKAFTTIDGNISAVATEITFIDASAFPSTGPFVATVEDEIILFASRTGNICTVATTGGTLGVDGRGYDGSAAAPHSDGDTIANKIVAAYVNNLWDELSLNSTGGSITGDVSITGELTANYLTDSIVKSYTEKHVSVAPSTAGVLTLDLDEGNVFYATVTSPVTALVISNASTTDTSSITLDMLLTAAYSTAFYLAWQTPYAVVSASTLVSCSTADNSFNHSGSAFQTNVQAGDIVTVTGFSTAAPGNNDSWRVISATNAKIVVTDDFDTLTTVAAGSAVSLTRRKEYFLDTDVPAAPSPYIPKTFTGYSKDGDRWKIIEVGEF